MVKNTTYDENNAKVKTCDCDCCQLVQKYNFSQLSRAYIQEIASILAENHINQQRTIAASEEAITSGVNIEDTNVKEAIKILTGKYVSDFNEAMLAESEEDDPGFVPSTSIN